MTLAPPDSSATSRGPLGEALSVVVLRPAGNGRPQRGRPPQPPLAALTLAAWLREAPGTPVADGPVVLDAALEGWNLDQTCEQLVECAPDVAIVHGESASPAHLEALFRALSERLPEVVAVLVAGHASEVEQTPLDLLGLRFAVHGDPERPLTELLAGLVSGRRSYAGVPGLDWRDASGRMQRQEALPPAPYLPATPAPAWDLVDLTRYTGRKRANWASLVTSRACPPGCPACRNAYGRVFRVREMSDVLAELRGLVAERDVRTVRLADEVFNHDLQRAKAFLRGFLREAPLARLELPNGLRPDRIDSEFAELLFRCGVRRCDVVVDSAAPSVQRTLRHNLDLSESARGIQHLAWAGLLVGGRFSLGWIEETEEHRAATATFARVSRLHFANFRIAASVHTPDGVVAPEVALEGLSATHRATRLAGAAFWLHPMRLLTFGRWGLRRLWWRLPQAKIASLPV